MFMQGGELVELPKMWNRASVIEWLICQVHDLCPGKDFSISDNFFEQGIDRRVVYLNH